MLCTMSPDVCKKTLGEVQFTVLAEFCQLRNLGEHVDVEACDDACLGIWHNYWAHLPIGIQTSAVLCFTSTTGTSCRWNWRIWKS